MVRWVFEAKEGDRWWRLMHSYGMMVLDLVDLGIV
jgi:hypothetical protein